MLGYLSRGARGGAFLLRKSRFPQARLFSTGASDAEMIARWGASPGNPEQIVSSEGLQVVKLHQDENGVLELTLNRPEKFNALNMAMFEDLEIAFHRIAKSKESVKCVVVSGNGPNFCAGIDLGVLLALKQAATAEKCPARMRENLGRVIKRFQQIMSLPEQCHAPVIAATQGLCIGAGVDFITACDLRICSADAKFSVKEVDLAIVADLGTLQRLPKAIGEQRARELAYTGRAFSGSEAKTMGLVLDCVESPEELRTAALKLAARIAQKSPVTIRGVKENMNYSREHSVEEGLEYVLRWNESHLISRDLDEVMQHLAKQKK